MEPRTLTEEPQVLIVGAGPTGLLLAVELERRGVPVLLIDALDAPLTWDRATVLHERSLQIFAALGAADELIAAGVRTRGARFHSDGELLGELSLALDGARYGCQLGLSEEVTEGVLTRLLEAHGGAVTRSTRLVELSPGHDSVGAVIERAGDRAAISVAWVVGCDGLHSVVRDAAGIGFPGEDISQPWAVFDAEIAGWQGDYDLVSVHLDHPPVILTPLPQRRWRVYLRPTSAQADLIEDATGVLRRYAPGASFADVGNPTRFHCHSRVADRFRDCRVLLAGDAAHACTPAEGHGMNTGLQDAFNLGWKLAMVCRGEARPALLDSYETERRPVAERIVASGAETEAGQALADAAARAERDEAIRAMVADPELAHHEAAAESELDRLYPPSCAVAGSPQAALSPGALLPDTEPAEPAVGDPAPLHELAAGPGFTLLVLGGADADTGRVGELVEELERERPGPVDAVVGLAVGAGPGEGVGSLGEATAARLGIEAITILAVRPDRFVGLRTGDDPGAVRAYFAKLAA